MACTKTKLLKCILFSAVTLTPGKKLFFKYYCTGTKGSVSRIQIQIQLGPRIQLQGSKKKAPQKEKTKKFSCFEELDVLCEGLAAILELRNNSHRSEKKLIQHL
jgi:hypothetical protein